MFSLKSAKKSEDTQNIAKELFAGIAMMNFANEITKTLKMSDEYRLMFAQRYIKAVEIQISYNVALLGRENRTEVEKFIFNQMSKPFAS